jgi:FMN reductase
MDNSGAKEMQELIRSADGVVLATPEYHGTFSSLMKLALENMGFPSPLKGKTVALLGVAGGRIGAVKSLEHLRSVAGHIGAVVVPKVVSVARVREAFDDQGNCLDPEVTKDIRGLGLDLVKFIHESRCPEVSFEEWVRRMQLEMVMP